MRLQSLSYSENEGKPEEWSVKDLDFGQMTLIVGINASGKTCRSSESSGHFHLFAKV